MLEIVAAHVTELVLLPNPQRAAELVKVLTELNPNIEVAK